MFNDFYSIFSGLKIDVFSMVFESFGGFRKVREVNWKNFLPFSSRSDFVVPSYEQTNQYVAL